MSRLDWFTIAVVAICILAILFLLGKTSSLLNNENSIMTDPNTEISGDTDLDSDESDIYTDETLEPSDMDEDSDNSIDAAGDDAIASSDGDSSEDEGANTGKSIDASETDIEEPIEEEEPVRVNTSPSSGSASSGGNFMVVAGSFAQMINAENMVRDLQKKGFASAEIGKFNAGKYATALAGRFDSQAEAQSLVADLKAKGIDAYIQKRK